MPTVSIVLPTYNGARFLREAIDSCLAQSFTDFELIVVVDGSTDGTEAILAGYSDPRLVVVKKPNGGLPRALNSGFERARGRYWSWTSDDNDYLPEALRVMVEHLERHSSAPMVCTDCVLIDDGGRTIGYSDTTWACFLYRAEVARAVGEYRAEFPMVEDVDFFIRLQHAGGPIERVAEAHYKYREHAGSLSSTAWKKRAFMSLCMHYDLMTRGIEKEELRELFFDRLSRAALHRDHDEMAKMIGFAREKRVPFLAALERHDRLLRTPPGWLYNRLRVGLMSRYRQVERRVKLLARK